MVVESTANQLNLSLDKVQVTIKLSPDIRDLTLRVALAKGVDMSEHIRSLIIEDLDHRGLLEARLHIKPKESIK